MDTNKGLEKRFWAVKLDNPEKKVDGIMMEWDDEHGRKGIIAWARSMRNHGYEKLYEEVLHKLALYDGGFTPPKERDGDLPTL